MKKRIYPYIGAMTAGAALLLTSCAGRRDTVLQTETASLKELKIGSSVFAPYFYVAEDGSYSGVDVEIAQEACSRMGYTPVFTEITWGEQDLVLDNGTVDCIWSNYSMDGREEQYDWAGPYLHSPEVVVTAADGGIRSLEDLEGKTVAVRVDSRAENYFLEQDAPEVAAVCTYSSMEDAFAAFGKGYVDAVADHEAALKTLTEQEPQLYRYLDPPLLVTSVGVAFQKGCNDSAVKRLDEILHEMNQDGTTARIAEKYGLDESCLVEE